MSISDQALSCGALSSEAIHGESIKILGGPDAGKTFIGIVEIESDFDLETGLGLDPRGKRVVRFRLPNVPNIESQTTVQIEDGTRWKAVRLPRNNYLTADFELKEQV
jgi:hypothetical protein